MKKLIASTLILLAYSNTQAQEEQQYGFNKGDIIISGTVSYNNQNSNYNRSNNQEFESKANSFQVSPEVAYFISDHIMTGLKIGYLGQNNSNDTEYNSKTRGYSTSIFGRYYITPKKRISLFIELDAGYNYSKSKSETTNANVINFGENINNRYAITASPGINIFLNKKFSLTSRIGNIGYSTSKNEYTNSVGDANNSKLSQLNATLGLSSFYFGVTYRI